MNRIHISYQGNQGNKSTCPYCEKSDLWGSDYVIREKGKTQVTGYDSTFWHFVVDIYYVRCCEKCFKRRKRLDKIKNLMFILPFLYFVFFLIMVFFVFKHIHIDESWSKILGLIMSGGFVISIISSIASLIVYPIYNLFHKNKRVVTKEKAQKHNALFTKAVDASSINHNPLEPFSFGKIDMQRFEKEAGLSKNPHFYPGFWGLTE